MYRSYSFRMIKTKKMSLRFSLKGFRNLALKILKVLERSGRPL